MALETIILLFIFGLFFLLIIGSLALWIWMLVDCIKRKFKKEDEKIIWLLVIILVQVIGAIIYYFVIKREDKK
ncbi:PLDc_N domain-containing protein [Candidatus Pacearchaeota archaeon]|nr:PLDc_N domain-containing protein [Candidatus Pacearchaeota archaeon]